MNENFRAITIKIETYESIKKKSKLTNRSMSGMVAEMDTRYAVSEGHETKDKPQRNVLKDITPERLARLRKDGAIIYEIPQKINKLKK